MVKVPSNGETVQLTPVTGSTAICKVTAHSLGPTATTIPVIFKKTKNTVSAPSSGKTEKSTLENGSTDKNMASE
jgi:hypothetical protein